MKKLDWLDGSFDGSGSWHEATGRSQNYRVHQTNRWLDDGFEVIFRHDFEDGDVIDAHFTMLWLTDRLFSVSGAGKILGSGYLIDDFCHYHLEVGPYVEVNLLPSRDGLSIFGSSTRNKEGHYIAWHETLRRSVPRE